MRRFFCEGGAIGEVVELPASESRHISRVLRLNAGEPMELLDGSGRVFSAVLVETGRQVWVKILDVRTEQEPGTVSLVVGQGQLKGQKMDTVVQKCTELGVTQLVPFWSSRCQGKLADLQGAKKHERYQRIVEAACKQCSRPELMTVDSPCTFVELLAAFPEAEDRLRLLFWEEEREISLHAINIPATVREVVVVLGPEGGLAPREAEEARGQGWRTVSLGRRILRAETATLAAAAILQFLVKNV